MSTRPRSRKSESKQSNGLVLKRSSHDEFFGQHRPILASSKSEKLKLNGEITKKSLRYKSSDLERICHCCGKELLSSERIVLNITRKDLNRGDGINKMQNSTKLKRKEREMSQSYSQEEQSGDESRKEMYSNSFSDEHESGRRSESKRSSVKSQRLEDYTKQFKGSLASDRRSKKSINGVVRSSSRKSQRSHKSEATNEKNGKKSEIYDKKLNSGKTNVDINKHLKRYLAEVKGLVEKDKFTAKHSEKFEKRMENLHLLRKVGHKMSESRYNQLVDLVEGAKKQLKASSRHRGSASESASKKRRSSSLKRNSIFGGSIDR